MPRIPTYSAEGGTPVVQYPSRYPANPSADLTLVGGGLSQTGQAIGIFAGVTARIQAQADERSAAVAAAKRVELDELDRTNMFLADPDDPEAVLPPLRQREGIYREQRAVRTEELAAKLTPGARAIFSQYVKTHDPILDARFRAETQKVAISQEQAGLEPLRDIFVRNYVAAETPEQAQEYASQYFKMVDRSVGRGIVTPLQGGTLKGKFEPDALAKQTDILIKTPEGREQFYRMDDAGDLDKMDPQILERRRYTARAADAREEEHARVQGERIKKEANNEYGTQLGELITQSKREEATAKLDFLEKARLLPAVGENSIQHWREQIAKPAIGLPSDPDIRTRVLLDVEGIRPKTTEAEIDALVAMNQRGGKGLNLADATSAKNQLRATRVANEDRGKSDIREQHNQAEQELKAMLGIRPDIIQSAMQDDPAGRLYGVLLPELRRRSLAFPSGTENPLTVVEEMGPRVRASLGEKAILKTDEIRGLLLPPYRDSPDQLKKDRQEGKISEESYRQQLRLWTQMPKAPSVTLPSFGAPPAAPGAKRKTYGQ